MKAGRIWIFIAHCNMQGKKGSTLGHLKGSSSTNGPTTQKPTSSSPPPPSPTPQPDVPPDPINDETTVVSYSFIKLIILFLYFIHMTE